MNNKRTGKFYRKNEADVIKQLGLIPTKGSGSGFLEKEDGYNDKIICQLKSTDAESITIKQHDLHTLVYNGNVSHKTPVFAIQYLNTGEVWIMAKPEDLSLVCRGLGERKGTPDPILRTRREVKDMLEVDQIDPPSDEECVEWLEKEEKEHEVEVFVNSSPEDRKKFFEQQMKRWKKE